MYAEMYAGYRDEGLRGRVEMCARQQSLVFTADGRADIKALADGVLSGSMTDIDAVIAAVSSGPNWNQLDDDGALLAAVQGAWPGVAAARYPAT